jgi:hypothetical protein
VVNLFTHTFEWSLHECVCVCVCSKGLKKLSRVKHSSLFVQSVSVKDKKFDKIDTGSLVEATIGAAANQRKK